MSGKPRNDQEKAEQSLAELREAIQEVHGLLRDIKQTKREVQDMIRKSRLDWEKETQEYVQKELDELGADLKKHINAEASRVGEGFDKLHDELNGTPDWAGGKTIGQLIRESIRKVEREAIALSKFSGVNPE